MPSRQANLVLRYIRNLAAQDTLNLPDHELLQRFVTRHDGDAFAALVRRHGPMVLRLCQRVLQNKEDAEDAFQATFLVLCRKAASLRPHGSLCGWLHSVAYRVAQKARIAAARRRKHEGCSAERQTADSLAEITLREAHAILDQELVRLPDKFRVPLMLCYLEGLTNDEAAQQLGWPPSTLKSRLAQARDRLRGRLASRGLALSEALIAALFYQGTASGAVPPALLDATVRAAPLIAARGVAATSVVSAEVAALMKGVTQVMFLSKLKFVGVTTLLLCLVGVGASALTYQAFLAGTAAADEPAKERAVKPAADKPRDPNKPKEGDKPRDGDKPRAKDQGTAQEKVTLTGKVSKEERKVPTDDGGTTTVTRYYLTEANGNKVQLPPPRKNEAGALLDNYNLEDFVGKQATVTGRAVQVRTAERPDAPAKVIRLLTISEIKLIQ